MSALCPDCGSSAPVCEFRAPAFDPPQQSLPASYPLLRCGHCRLVFTGGVDEQLLEKVYAADYYGSAEQKFQPLIESLLAFGARRRAREMVKRWRDSPSAVPSALDVGCGRGLLLRALRDQGATVQGVERSLEPVEQSLRNSVHIGDVADLAASGQAYDLVIFWHVLEHICAPGDCLAALQQLLRRDALLVITVPNFASLQRRLFGRHWFHLDLPRHVVHFEPEQLGHRLVNSGYVIEKTSFFEPAQSLYGFVQSAMNKLFPRRPNRLYSLLKFSGRPAMGQLVELGAWLVLAGLLLPFAIVETMLGVMIGRGATLQLYARYKGVDHD